MKFNFKKSNTKIFIYKENSILKKNKMLSTSFFSPFDGQIIKTQLDSLGKKNCLVLTNNDQITFSISILTLVTAPKTVLVYSMPCIIFLIMGVNAQMMSPDKIGMTV